MLTQIDMERIPSYRRGMEKGMEQGKAMGEARGEARGEAMFLMRQLDYKFGDLPPALTRRVRDARSEELATWGERVLSAQTLEEVFQ